MSAPRAAIFDMDGLLIDSEPIWREVEIEVFADRGIALTDAMCRETTGLRIDEVVVHHLARAGHGPDGASAMVDRIVDRMIERVRAEGTPIEGSHEALTLCATLGLALALASSSPRRLIDATLEALGMTARFPVVRSAEHEAYGKPHPAVYLRTAEALGVPPTACVVLEDSINGVIAAKAARMRCIAVPQEPSPRFAVADAVIDSLGTLSDRPELLSE
ncbi:MAG: hexitol phosphatase HxpB [Sandaracinaceae bacterium]